MFLIFGFGLLIQLYVNVDGLRCQKRAPEQIRVAIRDVNLVTISWKTYGYPNGSDDTPQPYVEYNTDGDFLHHYVNTSTGSSTIYDKLQNISWFHNCIMAVNFSQKYYYRIPAGECVDQSGIYAFTAQPNASDPKPINITIFGDLGYVNDLNKGAPNKTIRALINVANSTSFFMHIGDISYADDKATSPTIAADYEALWDSFQQQVQPVTTTKFYMTAPGNHEVTCTQYGDSICTGHHIAPWDKKYVPIISQYRNFSAYMNRFYMPGGDGQSNSSYRNLWYSFDFGLEHIVIINTETDFPSAPSVHPNKLNATNFAPDGAQINWLIKDLKAATDKRKLVPWIIVAGHRPFFGSKPSPPSSNNCPECKSAFSDILFQFKVDFYFCGHVHWYERLFPVDSDGKCPPEGCSYINQTYPIHVTTGAGGAPEKAQHMEIHNKFPTSAYYNSTYGYSQLQIQDANHCELIFYDSVRQNITDRVKISRSRT